MKMLNNIANYILSKSKLSYHNEEHIACVLDYLKSQKEGLTRELELAALYHDIVYDKFPDKEERSANLFRAVAVAYPEKGLDVEKVVKYISATKTHRLEADNLEVGIFVRADLEGLTKRALISRNYERLLEESIWVYNCLPSQFAKANKVFCENLINTMQHNTIVDPQNGVFYQKVILGLKVCISLGETLTYDY